MILFCWGYLVRTSDWIVVGISCAISLAVGLLFSRGSTKHGAEGYFTGNRDLPWWAIGFSNTATYQSGNGPFVMLILVFGLAGNWLWWSSWIIWMPLVAIVWARMWRRMQIVTTAELITLRYGGRPAQWARKAYAVVCCFGFAVLLIGYITGFFAKTIAPLVPMSETQILLVFGGITVLYTMFGGLAGVVYVAVVQFFILTVGSTLFFFMAVAQHGGWEQILHRVASVRPEALAQTPPVPGIESLLVLVLVLQGLFFAGSPTGGEGMTAQRFMAARSERHAMGGQLFNAFLALLLRLAPLIGLGVVALSLFWTSDLVEKVGPAPNGMTMIDDPVFAWAELIKRCRLPLGFVGLLVAAEVAAYMSTLSSLINWGSSFVVNDLVGPVWPNQTPKHEIWVSRITTLILFVASAAVAVMFVEGMVSWFMFINSAMVTFLLPLAWFRFFWWRFNVWGELAAIVLGLPLSIIVWFVLDFQDKPMWQGIGLLFALSFAVLITITLITPAESRDTLTKFYQRCRPPGLWGPIRGREWVKGANEPSVGRLLFDSALGIVGCLGLVLLTNAVFVGAWMKAAGCATTVLVAGVWLIGRAVACGETAGEPLPTAEGEPVRGPAQDMVDNPVIEGERSRGSKPE